MHKIAQIIPLIVLVTLNPYLRSEELEKPERAPPSMLGTTLSLNVDFDMFRGDIGTKRKPQPPVYLILPSPEGAGWGRNITYLGRMTKGTILEIVEIEKNEEHPDKPYYLVRPITPLHDRFKVDTSNKRRISDENIDTQAFRINILPWSRVGLWGKGYYPDGTRMLNETWFTIVNLNE